MSKLIKTSHVVIVMTVATIAILLGLNAERSIIAFQRIGSIDLPNLGCAEFSDILDLYPYIVYINDSTKTRIWGIIGGPIAGVPHSYRVRNVNLDIDLIVTEMTPESVHRINSLMHDQDRLDSLEATQVSISGFEGILMNRVDGGSWLGIPRARIELSSPRAFEWPLQIEVSLLKECPLWEARYPQLSR